MDRKGSLRKRGGTKGPSPKARSGKTKAASRQSPKNRGSSRGKTTPKSSRKASISDRTQRMRAALRGAAPDLKPAVLATIEDYMRKGFPFEKRFCETELFIDGRLIPLVKRPMLNICFHKPVAQPERHQQLRYHLQDADLAKDTIGWFTADFINRISGAYAFHGNTLKCRGSRRSLSGPGQQYEEPLVRALQHCKWSWKGGLFRLESVSHKGSPKIVIEFFQSEWPIGDKWVSDIEVPLFGAEDKYSKLEASLFPDVRKDPEARAARNSGDDD